MEVAVAPDAVSGGLEDRLLMLVRCPEIAAYSTSWRWLSAASLRATRTREVSDPSEA